MRLTVDAWRSRQAARDALQSGDPSRALELALDAQAVQATGPGEALRLLCDWVQAISHRDVP